MLNQVKSEVFMRLMKQVTNYNIKSVVALLLVFVTAFGAVPLHVYGSEGHTSWVDGSSESFYAVVGSERTEIPADGIVTMEIEGHSSPVTLEIPRYIYSAGERIYLDDPRVQNIAPVVQSPIMALTEDGRTPPPVGFIITVLDEYALGESFSAVVPPDPGGPTLLPVFPVDGVDRIYMDGRAISALRYFVVINGVQYDAFCANPYQPGPEHSSNPVYQLVPGNPVETALIRVLRYGWGPNPYL